MKLPRLTKMPISYGAVAEYRMNRAVADKFVGYGRFDDGVPTVMWHELPNGNMALPRACCPVPNPNGMTLGPRVRLTSKFEPRDSQQTRLATELTDMLDRGESFVLEAPTGVGKTVLGCHAIGHVGRRACVVLYKEDLFDSWTEDLGAILGLGKKDIGIIKQDRVDAAHPVVLASIQTLAIPGRVPARVLREFGFVIWDEVHVAPAETFSKSLTMFPARLRLGLSATPKRQDGKHFVTAAHIGPVAVLGKLTPMKPKVSFIKTRWRAPRDKDGERLPITAKSGHIFRMMTRNHARNVQLARLVVGAIERGRRIIIFSHQRDHLDTLMALVNHYGIPEDRMGLYVGGLKKAEREKAKKAQALFATYQMGDTGTNIPELDTVLLATPRANVKQTVGRGLRKLPGKATPVVIDLVDTDSPTLVSWARKRESMYRGINGEIAKHWEQQPRRRAPRRRRI